MSEGRGAVLLSKALLNAPAPPCDRYECELKAKCAAESLACKAMALYVTTGQVLHPTFAGRKRHNGRRLKTYDDEPQPTRDLYEKAFLCADSDDVSWRAA